MTVFGVAGRHPVDWNRPFTPTHRRGAWVEEVGAWVWVTLVFVPPDARSVSYAEALRTTAALLVRVSL